MEPNFNEILISQLNKTLEKALNDKFDDYKENCLRDLSNSLELKRNEVVKNILDSIDIAINNNQPYSLDPIINITIKNVIQEKR